MTGETGASGVLAAGMSKLANAAVAIGGADGVALLARIAALPVAPLRR